MKKTAFVHTPTLDVKIRCIHVASDKSVGVYTRAFNESKRDAHVSKNQGMSQRPQTKRLDTKYVTVRYNDLRYNDGSSYSSCW